MKKLLRIILPMFLFLCFLLPVFALGEYVRDEHGVLTQEEVQLLNEKAARISQEQNCGIYIRVMNNKEGYDYIEDYSEYLYIKEGLGLGPDSDGVLLVLDMEERYYDIVAYGDRANRAFTDYAKSVIADEVVNRMSNGNFYDAFNRFIDNAEYDLEREAMGEPVDVNSVHSSVEQKEQRRKVGIGITAAASPLTSLLICLGMRSRHRTKGRKYEAYNYIPENGINLDIVQDQFLYRREHRSPKPRIESSSGGGGGGGTSINSGGFSHSSGRF